MYETQGDQPFTIYPILYNNVTAVCTFMGCDRDLLKDTHTDDDKSASNFFFRAPKSFDNPFQFSLYKTNR